MASMSMMPPIFNVYVYQWSPVSSMMDNSRDHTHESQIIEKLFICIKHGDTQHEQCYKYATS